MGFFSSVKKFFKKVTKSTIGKIIAAVFLIAAVVFTAGAALGVAAMAGGWGAAAAGVTSSLGLTGTAAGIMTGALTSAGYGAAIGGGMAAITGGDILEGAAGGALTGAVTGGALGGLGFNVDPLANTFAKAPPPITGAAGAPGAAGPAGVALESATTGAATTGAAGMPGAAGPAGVAQAGTATTGAATPASGGLFSTGGWLERNGALVGEAVSGLGKGAMTGLAAGAETDAANAEQRRITDSYGIDYARLEGGPVSTNEQFQSPSERFSRNSPAPPPAAASAPSRTAGRYIYDREARQVVRSA